MLTNLNPAQIALFEEQSTSPMGVDLEVQSTRCYPYDTTAAHVLGHLQRDDDSKEGEEAFFSFRLPDYRGVVGVEYGFDKELRGTAGAKSVLVNNAGYRQTENVWSPAEPGQNVVLTIDLRLQQAAERALQGVFGPATRGAVVVMDVHTGDILAMASSPTLNPNSFIPRLVARGIGSASAELHAEKNRATQENYMPGSIFKPVVGMAALEAGLEPGGDHPRRTQSRPAQQRLHSRRQSHFQRPGPARHLQFPPRAEAFQQLLFHHHAACASARSELSGWASGCISASATGLPTRQEVRGSFPSLRQPQLRLDRRRHRQPLHRPGPGAG